MKIISKLFRFLLYAGLITLVVITIQKRKESVLKSRQKKIISIFSEWDTHGFPVNVYNVKSESMKIKKIISAKLYNNNRRTLISYVSKEIWEKISLNTSVEIKYKNNKLRGKISYIKNEIDLDSGLHPIRIEIIKTKKFNLKKDSTIPVSLIIKELKNVIKIPEQAVIIKNGDKFVWIVTKNKKTQLKKVKTSKVNGNFRMITRGLKWGDLVVVNGFENLKEDSKIRIYKSIN